MDEFHKVQFKQEISINKEQWKDMFCNKDVFYEKDSSLVLHIYNMGGKATATEIANDEGVHPSSYNASIVNLGRRIKKYLNIEVPKNRSGENRWWHVLFWGNYKENGHFNWILRPELKEAIDDLVLLGKVNSIQNALKTPEIRIMPMSKAEFDNKSTDTVQQEFFIDDLRCRDECLYYFKNTAINCPNNTLLLFQYDNKIIACARLRKIIRYEVSKDGIYYGALQLKPNTIQIFDPITTEEIKKLDSGFKKFSQAKQTISLDYLPKLLELIDSKKVDTIAEELALEDTLNLFEGARKRIIINAYERNVQARKKCIEFHGAVCQICGFDFQVIYGSAFKGKIHVHHLKPLHEIDKEYQVDPVNDLIPICPNCHLVVHSKNPPYTPQQVKEMIKR